jgi:hypothetical protein
VRYAAAARSGGAAAPRQWIERSFGTLEPILSAGSFVGIGRRMWAGGELGHGDGADRDLDRKL